jgi:menaquinone-dependent protoporphyrinogen oxidase
MAVVLVVFESKYGQSSKVAEHIGEVSRRRDHVARVLHVDNLGGVEPSCFDAVVVVAPVYYSRHPRSIVAFMREHAATLATRRSAFFSVSNSAASRESTERSHARRLASTCAAQQGWSPDVIATAGGAIAYPRYGFLVRFMMRRIALSRGLPTDTRRVYEWTDWEQVDRDVETLLEPLEGAPAPLEHGSSSAPVQQSVVSA